MTGLEADSPSGQDVETLSRLRYADVADSVQVLPSYQVTQHIIITVCIIVPTGEMILWDWLFSPAWSCMCFCDHELSLPSFFFGVIGFTRSNIQHSYTQFQTAATSLHLLSICCPGKVYPCGQTVDFPWWIRHHLTKCRSPEALSLSLDGLTSIPRYTVPMVNIIWVVWGWKRMKGWVVGRFVSLSILFSSRLGTLNLNLSSPPISPGAVPRLSRFIPVTSGCSVVWGFVKALEDHRVYDHRLDLVKEVWPASKALRCDLIDCTPLDNANSNRTNVSEVTQL